MGLFSRIMDKLRQGMGGGQPSQAQAGAPSAPSQQQQYAPGAGTQPAARAPAAQQAGGTAALQDVDVEKVLSQMAQRKGGGGNWRTSIMDLLKLLDLDSSLDARKELAAELGVNAGAHGSAEQNIALHKAVMRKVAENGGRVPDSLKD